ncbi:conditioned medium-induced protein 4 [Halorubellus sp. JP-L1]|uniref:conditioned medium-induced protein 4 n=1 Tax=Halorubellus sp. JP-L1 TaxID=2715753 RepID=UPI001407F6F5|nr:conditioned medium-induced protein 4 [Halorubellus sp. JP-L1]NHN43589.1 conditioned medium-induced protein 4 [Halorubellus sp. JP-L1]
MDRKTEELRDIFMDVAGDDTVTESQEESRGSLTDRPDDDSRLHEIVGTLRERYGFGTDLDDDALVHLVRAVYDGQDDDEIADALDANVDAFEVFIARTDLHIVDENDDLPDETDLPDDGVPDGTALDALRDAREEGLDAVADAFDVDERTARRYVIALDAVEQSRAANDRYRDAFDDALTDAGLSTNLDSAREDGLDEATEGMEVDVDF